jgi:hypothetical protein
MDTAWLMISAAFGAGHEHDMAYETGVMKLAR